MYEPEAIVGLRDEPGMVGWALCIDAHGHGLYLQWKTLHAMLLEIPSYTPDRAFVGDNLAAFLAALASH